MHVRAPHEYDGDLPGIFLAGGITDAPVWQPEAADRFAAAPVAVFNPRRDDYPAGDPDAERAQVDWEFRYLRRAAVVLFWLVGGPSAQPITLFELGSQAATGRPIVVGCDPRYVRRVNIRHQLALLRPELTVHDTLPATCAAALDLLSRQPGPPPSGPPPPGSASTAS